MPRAARRREVRSIAAFSGVRRDHRELTRQVRSIAAQKQVTEAYQHCPGCGADQFTQQATRGDLLA